MFDQVFISKLPEDGLEASVKICDKFFEIHKSLGSIRKQKNHIKNYFKALAFAEVFIEAKKINYGPFPHIESGGKDYEVVTIKRICDFFADWQSECSEAEQAKNLESTFVHAKEEYASMLGKTIAYKLSDAEYVGVQHLLKEIIEELYASTGFEMEYKNRLLNKFRKLQEALKPNICHFDGIWGMMVDIWVAIGKSPSAARPLAKKAEQMIDIVWAIQANTEGVRKLSPIRLLPDSNPAIKQKAVSAK